MGWGSVRYGRVFDRTVGASGWSRRELKVARAELEHKTGKELSTTEVLELEARLREEGYGDSSLNRVGYGDDKSGNTSRSLGAAFLGVRFDEDLGRDNETLSTGYLLPFEIVSIHLLVVLVGAGYLARAKRRVTRIEDE